MPPTLSLTTLLASTGLLAYFNAKYAVTWDLWTLYHQIGLFALHMARREKRERLNIFYLLEELALDPKTAEKVFLITPKDEADGEQTTGREPQRQWTYREAYSIVLKYARYLQTELGVGTSARVDGQAYGEIVAMDFPNRPEFVWVWFALWSLGCVPAFINTNLRGEGLVHCVKVSSARLLLMDSRLEDALSEDVISALGAKGKKTEVDGGEGGGVEIVVFDPEKQKQILEGEELRAPDSVRDGARQMTPAMLIYTSGTTGLPKAAKVQWAKPWSGIRLFSPLIPITPSDTYLTALPLYHSSGSVLGVLQVLNAGATIVLCPRFSPKTFMRWCHETNATGIHYIGEMCRYLVSSPPSKWDRGHEVRFAFGNGLRPEVWEVFKERFGVKEIVEFYGATEGTSSSYIHSRNDYLLGAVGRQGLLRRHLLNSLTIVQHDSSTDSPYRDPETGFCVPCRAGEAGELVNPLDPADIGGRFLGYFGDQNANEKKILRDVLRKGDAYFRAGDLMMRDEEGRLWFVDRVGDTFRWKSENVSTTEVTSALSTHPAIAEANVYGITLPSHDGRAGCAAIVLHPSSTNNTSFTNSQPTLTPELSKSLAEHARKLLPAYAVPVFLRVVKEVQVTGTLKQMKVGLRDEGVRPGKLGEGDEMFWMERGGECWKPLGPEDWEGIVGGRARL